MSGAKVYYPENFNALVSLFDKELNNYIVYNRN